MSLRPEPSERLHTDARTIWRLGGLITFTICAVIFLVAAGLLIWFDVIPWYVQSKLLHWMPHDGWGVLFFLCGFWQWWFADTRATHLRAIVATATAVLCVYLVLTYIEVGDIRRLFLPLMSILALGELWIAWRAWHDWGTARRFPGLDRRRRHGD